MQLGRKIRDLRLRRGLTVQKLADASHLSKGFISQVENERTSPSLATLRDLAAALRTSVAYLVVEDDPTPHVTLAGERPRVDPAIPACTAELLSAVPGRNLEMLLLELAPGGRAGEHRHSHHGEECLLCLEGEVRVVHGEREWTMAVGDCCQFDGRIPHTLENAGAAPARLVMALTPASHEAEARPRAESPSGDGQREEVPAL
jgi:transcriptional regulator with XRE-family HTH domain